MKAQQLKNAILQLAIQGKLVPQDPNDEPAQVLLEKISKEKEQLIAESKIKKSKKTAEKNPYTDQTEMPFEIPDSWVWVRLGDISIFNANGSIYGKDIPDDSWILDLEDIEKETGVLLTRKRKNKDTIKSQKNIFYKNDILYSKLRPYLNKVIIADRNGFSSTEIIPIQVHRNVYSHFFQVILMSVYFLNYAKKNSHGTKMPRLNLEKGKDFLFPLPPLAEQKRIVAKIEALLPFVEQYAKKEQELTALHQSFPSQLKKSILQAAIQGKLVEQNPQDEPAMTLIARIQAEKDRLISEKKLKKPKQQKQIFRRDNSHYELVDGTERCIDEELPFELPESWCWVRLENIGEIISGVTYSKFDQCEQSPNSIRVLRGGNILNNNLVLLANDVFIKNNKVNQNQYIKYNDIITPSVTSLENVGKFALIKENKTNVAFGGFVFCLRFNKLIFIDYIFYILTSEFIRNQMRERTNKSGQAFYNLGKSKFNEVIIPIPPITEQKRIVKKIEELFLYLQKFDKN